jgi:CheY-like chemotaxis protein
MSAKQATVLLVDDDNGILEIASAMLEECGVFVIGVSNPFAALEIVRTNPDIDLLFTDIVMPGAMSGFRLASAARQIRPDLAVLYSSGYMEDAPDQGGVRHGRVLHKPWNFEKLQAEIRAALC